DESRDAEAGQAVERSRTAGFSAVTATRLGGVPTARSAGAVGQAGRANQAPGGGGGEGGVCPPASQATDDAARSGGDHGTGVRGDNRRCQPVSAGQAGGQL